MHVGDAAGAEPVAAAAPATAFALFPGIGKFFSSAEAKVVVPSGPLGGGIVPVPPVRSTLTVSWAFAGPQVPEVPAILQRVTALLRLLWMDVSMVLP